MKIAILAGGKGTRLSELTKSIPKPMVRVGGLPILIHIIRIYVRYGFRDFYILAGFKSNIIKKFFKNFRKSNKSFEFKLKNKICNITIIDSGKNSMTGGRLKKN